MDRERLAQHGAHLLDQLKRLRLVLDLVADDRELVAADARDRVARPHDPLRRRATATSSRSPERWPRVSFTSLKRSTSSMQTAIIRRVRRARPIDVRSPSSRSVRLGSAGEGVVQRLMAQGLLGLPLLRHVVEGETAPCSSPSSPTIVSPHERRWRSSPSSQMTACSRPLTSPRSRRAIGASSAAEA